MKENLLHNCTQKKKKKKSLVINLEVRNRWARQKQSSELNFKYYINGSENQPD